MLQIRLNKGSSSDSGAGAKSLPAETVTVACPDHLVIADLPVAKGLGSATAASTVKILGRRSRRQLAERVHFCVRCDFPIAIYGRLSPCEHVFCLDCARSDSMCYICDERIQKIQTIKLMEGIFICAAPLCLKSFLKKPEFEAHILENHADMVKRSMKKKEEMNETEASGTKQSSTLDSTLRGPPRPGFPPSSNPQPNDRDDKSRRQLPREQPPARPVVQPKPPQYYGQAHPSEPQPDTRPMGIDGVVHGQLQQQSLDAQGGMQQDFGPSSDKQHQGILTDPHHEYEYPPLYPQHPSNFQMPKPMMLAPPPFGFSPFPSDGAPPFYGAPVPYEVARSDSNTEAGSEQGSLLGFPPTPGGGVSFPEGYPRPWSGGPGNVPFDASQGGQGVLAVPQPQAMPPPPPPPGPPPPHLLQHKHGQYSGDTTNVGKNY